ncbi:hypothetical protein CRG98_034407 [Punica granatum]|nr:hypothetical protein CRG98_034407 [Punica granatum]
MESFSSGSEMSWGTAIFSTVGSLVAAMMVFRSMAYNLFPKEVLEYFNASIKHYIARLTFRLTLVIDEYEGLEMNEVYEAAELVFASRISTGLTRLRVSKPEKQKEFSVLRETNTEIVDKFNRVELRWVPSFRKVDTMKVKQEVGESSYIGKIRYFELSFHKNHKDMVINSYLPHLIEVAKSLKQQKKTLILFTNSGKGGYSYYDYDSRQRVWTSVNLDHPATFETLAMESRIKHAVLDDVDQFVKRRDYYRRVGKAWKRGYLLYGPPGTGKSSLVAAMANYLKFDIYDLELTAVHSNSELRKLLVATGNRSILVVEDIDCSIGFHHRSTKANQGLINARKKKRDEVTLSGMLNFLDGLWSSCGDERIIVFMTNRKEKLDPALLRPGRMDFHVMMSYCTPCGFRQLSSNYLGLGDHFLFRDIEDLLITAEITPAEVAEQLLRGGVDTNDVLRHFIEFLKEKKEDMELKAKKIRTKKAKKKIEGKLDEKVLFKEIKDLIRSTKVTTAEMVHQLLMNEDNPTNAFMNLIEFLKVNKRQTEDLETAASTEEDSDFLLSSEDSEIEL